MSCVLRWLLCADGLGGLPYVGYGYFSCCLIVLVSDFLLHDIVVCLCSLLGYDLVNLHVIACLICCLCLMWFRWC